MKKRRTGLIAAKAGFKIKCVQREAFPTLIANVEFRDTTSAA